MIYHLRETVMQQKIFLTLLEYYAGMYAIKHQSALGLTGVHPISNRRHPGLVMEHYDPTTSVYTLKIACPRRLQDQSPRLSSPSTPSLSNSSR